MKKNFFSLLIILLLSFSAAQSQTYIKLTLDQYLEKVRDGNLQYAAERLNIELSEAQILSASVFNNPSIEFAYYNDELNSMQMGHGGSVEISQTISPGRRKAAINLAKSEKDLTHAVLIDYFRLLRQEATLTWLEAVKLKQLHQIKKESYKDQIKLMVSDSLSRGSDFSKDLDILQNRVETGVLYSELLSMEAEYNSLCASITNFCGVSSYDTVYIPEKKNIWTDKSFALNEIVQVALNNRADILALKKEIDVSKYAIKAAKTERIPEFDLFVGYGINAEARNFDAPSPQFNGFEVGISFPIPLFDRNRGEILSAETAKRQAEYRYLEAEMQVKSEVLAAYNSFLTSDNKRNLYRAGLVKNAKDALNQKREEYYNGHIHLIEVLDAQRSYDEILASFYSAIYEKSQSLVILESAIGIWEIE